MLHGLCDHFWQHMGQWANHNVKNTFEAMYTLIDCTWHGAMRHLTGWCLTQVGIHSACTTTLHDAVMQQKWRIESTEDVNAVSIGPRSLSDKNWEGRTGCPCLSTKLNYGKDQCRSDKTVIPDALTGEIVDTVTGPGAWSDTQSGMFCQTRWWPKNWICQNTRIASCWERFNFKYPADTRRNNVIMTSKRRRNVVLTSLQRCYCVVCPLG